jgi:hypothetical protein
LERNGVSEGPQSGETGFFGIHAADQVLFGLPFDMIAQFFVDSASRRLRRISERTRRGIV